MSFEQTNSRATSLRPRLVAFAEDAYFVVASLGRFDTEALHAIALRRRDQGASPQGMDAWEPWVHGLCTAMAPVAPPRWMPMAEAIEAGLSLEHGARGIRGLFTSKPSERDVARVRAEGAIAARILAGVLAAADAYRPDTRALRAAFLASLGLPEADRAALEAEEPRSIDQIEIQSEIEGKLARAIVRGAFFAAMTSGIDPREDQAVLAAARKLGVSTDDANQARNDAKRAIDGSKSFGESAVEAVRYLLEGTPQEAERFAIAAARLILPAVHRREAVTSINVGGPVALAKRHDLDKRTREAVLALAWFAALRTDPTFSFRAELASRHSAIAKDLGDVEAGAAVRVPVEGLLELELLL